MRIATFRRFISADASSVRSPFWRVYACLALADRAWRQDARRRRRHPVLPGLMGVLLRVAAAGRLPVWNDLWGLGFPGIGESQMGVYYPPHLVLYGLLPLERAYMASLVLHTLWGGLGACWAARRFGVSPVGLGAGGVSFSRVGLLRDSHAAPLGLHDRLLDALGVGAGVVDRSTSDAIDRGSAGSSALAWSWSSRSCPGTFRSPS